MRTKSIAIFSPAKVNLSLAVTGRREDGFHSLVSLAAQLRFGDDLWLEIDPGLGEDRLDCSYPGLPTGADNLILRAAHRFREAVDASLPPVRFGLVKRIPLAAGLGGGSSNAVAALKGLATLSARSVPLPVLVELAASLGSDCPLFLETGPVVLRGRGERVSPLGAEFRNRLTRYRLLLVKPPFGVETAWAYGQFGARGIPFSDPDAEEFRLQAWQANQLSTRELLKNDFEQIVVRKYLGLEAMFSKLLNIRGLNCLLSGSGSAFFCLADEPAPLEQAQLMVRECLGESSACIHTTFSST